MWSECGNAVARRLRFQASALKAAIRSLHITGKPAEMSGPGFGGHSGRKIFFSAISLTTIMSGQFPTPLSPIPRFTAPLRAKDASRNVKPRMAWFLRPTTTLPPRLTRRQSRQLPKLHRSSVPGGQVSAALVSSKLAPCSPKTSATWKACCPRFNAPWPRPSVVSTNRSPLCANYKGPWLRSARNHTRGPRNWARLAKRPKIVSQSCLGHKICHSSFSAHTPTVSMAGCLPCYGAISKTRICSRSHACFN
jgi:hypothetical protein